MTGGPDTTSAEEYLMGISEEVYDRLVARCDNLLDALARQTDEELGEMLVSFPHAAWFAELLGVISQRKNGDLPFTRLDLLVELQLMGYC